MINWHRLFGLGVTDFFADSGYEVKLEKDLSIKQQFLDVLIIEQESRSQIAEPPDGLENLARHNLMTYKSMHQPLDAWALDELIGHYVNYRKQSSASLEELLPVEDFELYAVCTRHPEKLKTQKALGLVKKGIYDAHWGSQQVRLIVLSEVPMIERNALWLLFSGIVENVRYGASNYHWRRNDVSTVMNDLYTVYQSEGFAMPYTVEDYKKDFKARALAMLTPDDLLEKLSLEDLFKMLPPEELLKRLPAEERLKGLPAEERLKGLPAEERLKGLPAEERLKGLTREQIEAYLKKLTAAN
jgi:hypothetical protein